jgi:hypothetical protein
MVPLVDPIGNPFQWLYSPPSHSTYNPLARWWWMLELHGHGTQLRDVNPRLEWAQRKTWLGIMPLGKCSKVYAKGVTLGTAAMQAVEARRERHLLFPKWDMRILLARPT